MRTIRLDNLKKRLISPYVAMVAVIISYCIKFFFKMKIGLIIHSPMLVGDAMHQLGDILQALIVIITVHYSRKPSEDYDFGRRTVQSIFSFMVGISLCLSAFYIVYHSVGQLFSSASPELLMNAEYLWFLMPLTLGSAALSLIGYFQQYVGSITGDSAVESDGKETCGDGRVELGTAIVIALEYISRAPRLEYIGGIVISGIVLHTAYGILAQAWPELSKKSIGLVHKKAIEKIVQETHGVNLTGIKTFLGGLDKAICILKLESQGSIEATYHIKHTVVARIARYLKSVGFKDAEYFVRFDPVITVPERHVYLLIKRGSFCLIAPTLTEATHMRICDIESGNCVRAFDEPLDSDVIKQLVGHQVCKVYSFSASSLNAQLFEGAQIAHDTALSYLPINLDIG